MGKPNVGKSTLINTLLSKKRMIVSPVPGTTRDSVDSVCTYYGRKYLLIDTAGIRRKDMAGYSIERFSAVRALRSIERCDVALIVMDASGGIVEQDQRIAGIVENLGKGALFLLNKWDLFDRPEEAYKLLGNELRREMWFMPYVPFLTVSALEKKRVTKIFSIIDEILQERKKRIPTADLNRAFREVAENMTLPLHKGKQVKLYYITQVKTEPPSFAVFVNYPAAIKDAHLRHMEKVLRNGFSFQGYPDTDILKRTGKNQKGVKYPKILAKSLIDFFKDGGFMLAGSLSYFFMMALVPLCLFLITIFGYILGHYRGFYEFFYARLVNFFPDITRGITKELGNLITFKEIGSFSIVLYGILSFQVFSCMESALNTIFEVKKKRTFLWSIVLSLIIVTLVIIVILVSFVATSLVPLLKTLTAGLPGTEDGRHNRFPDTIRHSLSYGFLHDYRHVCLLPEDESKDFLCLHRSFFFCLLP